MSEQAFTSYRDFEPQGFQRGLLVSATHWIGAGLSVFLVLGLVYWGYNLTVRDATDVPVVRALQGLSRVQPEDPGGEIVAFQGLAVNSVQAGGGAETPADQVILAPPPVAMNEEDVVSSQAEVVVAEINPALGNVPDASNVVDPGDMLNPSNLVDVSAQSTTDSQKEINDAIKRAVAEAANSPDTVNLAGMPGVQRSPRPRARVRVASVSLNTGTSGPSSATLLPSSAVDVAPSAIASGTRLVQLGAFDSRATAIQEWDHIVARHGDLVGSRKRFIQEAESGGRKFYRLRMIGFSSLADSRDTCAALMARGTPCIPVMAR